MKKNSTSLRVNQAMPKARTAKLALRMGWKMVMRIETKHGRKAKAM